MSSRMIELAKEASGLKEQSQTLEAQKKAVDKRLKQILEEELPEIMSDEEIQNFKVEGVGTVFLKTDVYSYVRADDKGTFYEWLIANGHEGLIVPYVHPATQKAFVKEQLNEGLPLPDFVNASFVEKAQIRRS